MGHPGSTPLDLNNALELFDVRNSRSKGDVR